MRVLHVIARLNSGGTAVYLENLSIGLTQSGVENMIATGYVQKGEMEDQCVERLPIRRVSGLGRAIRPIKDLRARKELKKIIREYKPDVIHSHTFKAGVLSRSIRSSSKYVHTFHGHIFNDGSLNWIEKWLVIKIEQHLTRRTDVLVSVGVTVGEELRALGIGTKNYWKSIAPGIKPPVMRNRNKSATKLGADPNKKTVGWLGRFVLAKDPELAIDVAKKLPHLQFILAGDGELLKPIRLVAPTNVIFPGWVSRDDFFSCTDMLMSTSKSEGVSIAVLEALSLQIPVIVPDVGSLSEAVINNANNGYIANRDSKSMAETIERVVEWQESRLNKPNSLDTKMPPPNSVGTLVEEHLSMYGHLL